MKQDTKGTMSKVGIRTQKRYEAATEERDGHTNY